MKKYENGKYAYMTEDEIAKHKIDTTHSNPPTETERLEALEQAFMELVEVVVNG